MPETSKGLGPYTDNVVDELYDGDPTASPPPNVSRDTQNPVEQKNTKSFIPYRTHEQHGVPFAPDTEGPSRSNKYAAEQYAFETYVDPKITPRDIEPIRPLAVNVIDTPNLLYRRLSRATTYGFDSTADQIYHQILQADPMRKRVYVRVRTTGTLFVVMLCPEQSPSDIDSIESAGTGTASVTLLDSVYTGPLHIRNVSGDGVLRVSVWTEYLMYDGERLMDQPYRQKGE